MVAKKKLKAQEIVIPDRLYFRIGEVAGLAQLPAYVLRFWETEFPQLKPTKSSTGQRMYRQRDVELVLRIKKLVHEQGFTLSGAREFLKAEAKPARAQMALLTPARPAGDELKKIRQGLREILGILQAPIKPKRARARENTANNAAG
jgi:DNA-binding transcriptional MerR regulator